MKHYLRHALATALAIALLTGCQSRSTGPEPTALVKLGFELQTREFASLVNQVTLSIDYTAPSIQDTTITLHLQNGEVVDTVNVVPDQEFTATLRAFTSGGTLLYAGDATATVPGGRQIEINILLAPPPDLLMLRAGPFFQTTTLNDAEIEVFVDVYNVDSLFGASFRMKYDTLLLDLVKYEEGDFLNSDGEELLTTTFAINDTAGVLGCVTTRQRHEDGFVPAGISGSGRLFTFTFAPKRAGQGIVEFVTDRSLPALRDPDLNPVHRHASLVLESATFSVEEGS